MTIHDLDRSSVDESFVSPGLTHPSPLQETLRVVRRNILQITAVTFVFTAASVLVTLNLPISYTSQAVMSVVQSVNDPLASPDTPLPHLEEGAAETATVLLKSRELAEGVVQLTGYGADPLSLWHNIGCMVGRWNPVLAPICEPLTPPSISQRVTAFVANLVIEPVSRSRAVTLALTAPTGSMAAVALNALMAAEQDRERNQDIEQTTRIASWLDSRARDLRDTWLQSEHRVRDYAAENGLPESSLAGTTGPLAAQQLAEAVKALSQSQVELSATKARVSALQGSVQGDKRGFIRLLDQPVIAASTTALNALYSHRAQMSQQFGSNYPGLQALNREIAQAESDLNAQVEVALRGMRRELSEKQAQTAELARNLDVLRQNYNVTTGQEAEEQRLAGVAAADKLTYQTFLTHSQQFADRSQIQQPSLAIVSHAVVPDAPSFPPKTRFVLAGLLFGLVAGAGSAIAREHLRDTFIEISRVGAALSLPLLATTPRIKRRGRGRRWSIARYVANEPGSRAAEAMRSVSASIMLADSGRDSPRVIAITSAAPREGKTVICCWLAIILRATGRRVLIIDNDHLAGNVARELGGRESGSFQDYMSGSATLKDVIQTDRHTDIDHMSAARIGNTSAQQPSIDRMRAAFSALKHDYGFIILDTPPLLASSEALLYCRAADQTLVVCRWRHTSRNSALASVDRLRSARARLTGVVLSMIDPRTEPLYSDTINRREQSLLQHYHSR